MRDTTENRKKIAPIICAVVVVALLGVILLAMLVPMIGEAYGTLMVLGVLAVYGLMIVAVIVGVLVALRQRLKEIEGGEEEDAKKY